VFFFAEKSDAEKCIEHFNGEWFDPRDKGRGPLVEVVKGEDGEAEAEPV
jgi:hypothetical protein